MTQTLVKTVANFETTLAAKIANGATSLTLTSAIDLDGDALAAGTYGFTINEGKSNEEHITGTVSGTAVSSIQSIDRGTGSGTSGIQQTEGHRKGSVIKITNFPALKRIENILDGTTDLDSGTPLKFDGNPSLTDDAEIATKKYVDDTANAGAADASTTVKGIVEEATQAEIDADTAAGGTSARLFTNPSTLATSKYGTRLPTADEKSALAGEGTPSSSNKYVTASSLQDGGLIYAASSAGSDTYAITLSPAPSAYAAGQVFNFKADVANTGAATLNVNSLGAKTIKKLNDQDLATGDIEAGQVVTVVYDGTSMQMTSQVANPVNTLVFGHGQATRDNGDGTGNQNIAHGLGVTPGFVKITVVYAESAGNDASCMSIGSATSASDENVTWFTSVGATSGTAPSVGQSSSLMVALRDEAGSNMGQATLDTVDSTNITINWTTAVVASGTAYIQWEAYGSN